MRLYLSMSVAKQNARKKGFDLALTGNIHRKRWSLRWKRGQLHRHDKANKNSCNIGTPGRNLLSQGTICFFRDPIS